MRVNVSGLDSLALCPYKYSLANDPGTISSTILRRTLQALYYMRATKKTITWQVVLRLVSRQLDTDKLIEDADKKFLADQALSFLKKWYETMKAEEELTSVIPSTSFIEAGAELGSVYLYATIPAIYITPHDMKVNIVSLIPTFPLSLNYSFIVKGLAYIALTGLQKSTTPMSLDVLQYGIRGGYQRERVDINNDSLPELSKELELILAPLTSNLLYRVAGWHCKDCPFLSHCKRGENDLLS